MDKNAIADKHMDILLCRQSIKNKEAIIKRLPAGYEKQIEVLKFRIKQDKKEIQKLKWELNKFWWLQELWTWFYDRYIVKVFYIIYILALIIIIYKVVMK